MGIELMNIRKKGLIIVFILSFLILPFFLSANDGKNQIIVNPQSLKFYAVIGATTTLSQVVSVFVSGNDSYKFESSSEWITVSAQSTDENNYILQVKINPRNLDIGIYEGAVKIAQNGAHNAKEIPVLLTIESKGSIIKNCHY